MTDASREHSSSHRTAAWATMVNLEKDTQDGSGKFADVCMGVEGKNKKQLQRSTQDCLSYQEAKKYGGGFASRHWWQEQSKV